ncbi:hypothetical protein ACFL2X_06665 [Candidatus Latescibacterota bacterium]
MEQETIVAVIAILALVVTLQQLKVQRKHNRLSVRPNLVFNSMTQYDSPQITIEISNKGLGPAIIKEVTYFVDDKQYDTTMRDVYKWKDILKKVDINVVRVIEQNLYRESVSAGESIQIVIAYTAGSQQVKIEAINRINIFVRYESIYKESFEVSFYDDL